MTLELENSFLKISSQNISVAEKRFFETLPIDYKRFLANTNGGFADGFKYSFDTGVPREPEKVDSPSRTDCVIEFFGIGASKNQQENCPQDLIKTAKEYDAEEFLPSGIIAIGSCIQNSLLCLSLRKEDFGQIYYWDWYWKYPPRIGFFQDRIDKVSENYPDAEEILDDLRNELYQKVSDEFNYATIVKVSGSFEAFLLKLRDIRDEE